MTRLDFQGGAALGAPQPHAARERAGTAGDHTGQRPRGSYSMPLLQIGEAGSQVEPPRETQHSPRRCRIQAREGHTNP